MSERQRIRQVALEAARQQGCTCDPAITLTGHEPLCHAQVARDDWCLLHRSREAAGSPLPRGPVVFVPPGWKAPRR